MALTDIPEPCQSKLLTHWKVDLGGSLAVASKGLYATGVSTDLNGVSRNCLLRLDPPTHANSNVFKLGREDWGYAACCQ